MSPKSLQRYELNGTEVFLDSIVMGDETSVTLIYYNLLSIIKVYVSTQNLSFPLSVHRIRTVLNSTWYLCIIETRHWSKRAWFPLQRIVTNFVNEIPFASDNTSAILSYFLIVSRAYKKIYEYDKAYNFSGTTSIFSTSLYYNDFYTDTIELKY